MPVTEQQIYAYLKESERGEAPCLRCGSKNTSWYPAGFQYVEDREYDAECRFKCDECGAVWYEQLKTVGIMAFSEAEVKTIKIDFLKIVEGLKYAADLIFNIPKEYKEFFDGLNVNEDGTGVDFETVEDALDEAEKVSALVKTEETAKETADQT